MSKRIAFTPASIDSLATGHLNDPRTPGLSIEVSPKGGRTWRYRRRVQGSGEMVKLTLGRYPQFSIADARSWAEQLNAQIEGGMDPRIIAAAEFERAKLTVDFVHGRYMEAVREGRASRAKKPNRARTIADKLAIFDCDIAPKLGAKLIFDVTEEDLTKLVLGKGRTAPVRANRLAAELKVFFGWASSLRGTEIGLTFNPAARLTDLKYPEAPRNRHLSLDEIKWFLRAVAEESLLYQRGMLLWLLTAARISEVILARADEIVETVWTIPPDRAKNAKAHRIPLGPWGQSLVRTNSEWLFPSDRVDGPRGKRGWYNARNRVLDRMSLLAGRSLLHWNPHDLRRTARSNTRRLGTDFETAEAMLNHVKVGLGGKSDQRGPRRRPSGTGTGAMQWSSPAKPGLPAGRAVPGGRAAHARLTGEAHQRRRRASGVRMRVSRGQRPAEGVRRDRRARRQGKAFPSSPKLSAPRPANGLPFAVTPDPTWTTGRHDDMTRTTTSRPVPTLSPLRPRSRPILDLSSRRSPSCRRSAAIPTGPTGA